MPLEAGATALSSRLVALNAALLSSLAYLIAPGVQYLSR